MNYQSKKHYKAIQWTGDNYSEVIAFILENSQDADCEQLMINIVRMFGSRKEHVLEIACDSIKRHAPKSHRLMVSEMEWILIDPLGYWHSVKDEDFQSEFTEIGDNK